MYTNTFFPCGLQGILIQFFVIASCLWWLCIAFNMLIMVVLEKGDERLTWIYHTICWSISAALTIWPAAKKEMASGIGGTFPFCWLDGAEIQGQFYIPIGVFCGIGITLVIIVMIKITLVTKSVAGTFFSIKILKRHVRPLLFIMIVLFPFLFVFGFYWRYFASGNIRGIEKEFIVYLQCRNSIANNGTCPQSPVPDFGTLVMNDISSCFIGIFVFLCFGLQKRWIVLWKDKLLKLKQKLSTLGSARSGTTSDYSKPNTPRERELSSDAFVNSSNISPRVNISNFSISSDAEPTNSHSST